MFLLCYRYPLLERYQIIVPHRIHSGVHLLYGQPFALSVKLCFLSRGKDDHPFFIIAFDFNLSFYQSGLCRFAGFAALEVEGGSKYPYLHGFALHDKGFCFIFGYFEIGFTFQINVSLFVGEFAWVFEDSRLVLTIL